MIEIISKCLIHNLLITNKLNYKFNNKINHGIILENLINNKII